MTTPATGLGGASIVPEEINVIVCSCKHILGAAVRMIEIVASLLDKAED
jgi:hypothetical protein